MVPLLQSGEAAGVLGAQRLDVAAMRRRRKRILHPEAGLLELDCQSLIDEDRAQVLALISPVAGTPAPDLTLLGLTSVPRP